MKFHEKRKVAVVGSWQEGNVVRVCQGFPEEWGLIKLSVEEYSEEVSCGIHSEGKKECFRGNLLDGVNIRNLKFYDGLLELHSRQFLSEITPTTVITVPSGTRSRCRSTAGRPLRWWSYRRSHPAFPGLTPAGLWVSEDSRCKTRFGLTYGSRDNSTDLWKSLRERIWQSALGMTIIY